MTGPSPFFVVGAPRSGTTMLRLALNAHPELAVPAETRYFARFVERHRGAPDGWRRAVESFLAYCEQRMEPPIELADVRERLLALPRPDYRALLQAPLARWAAQEGKSHWGEKTPLHIFHAAELVEMFPGARFVLLVRDPRAVASSLACFKRTRCDPMLGAILWRDVMTRGVATLECHVPASQRLTLRYEDLVARPRAALTAICAFLGHDFDEAMLGFHDHSDAYVSDEVIYDRLRAPIHGGEARWRRDLSARELAIVEAVCEGPMRAWGYAPDARPATPRERMRIDLVQRWVQSKQRHHPDATYHQVLYPSRLLGLRQRAVGV